jgi:predicted dehydrogenase
MRFLIAGFGSIGRRHFRNLVSLGEKDIIFLRSKLGSLPDEEISAYPVFTDIESALAEEPHAVIISNPTSLHLDIAIPAAENGCHILMEKPLANSMEQVPELLNKIKESGSRVLMGFQFRFHPGLIYTWRVIKEGRLGRILSTRAHWGEYLPGWHPWEDYRDSYSAQAGLGGGVILTLCHPLDYLRWLIGEVDSLWAFAGRLGNLELEVEDTAEIGLRFANGAYGSVHLSYNQKPTTHTLEIVGTEGTLRWEHATGAVEIYLTTNEEWQRKSLSPGFERNDLFRAQMQHFIEVVKGDQNPVCTLEDGINALELALAAKKSADFGQLVHLSPNEITI